MLGRKRPEKPHLKHADLFAARRQNFDRLACCLAARAHQDQNAFGVESAFIVEQIVAPSSEATEARHRARDDAGGAGMMGLTASRA